MLWLCLTLSGVRVTWPRLVLVGLATAVAVTAVSVADWSRGPDRRSHLGNFVQRIVDGDALDVVSRKAVASYETIASVLGIGSVLVGVALWFVMFRWAEPRLRELLRSTIDSEVITVVMDGKLWRWSR